MPTVDLKQFAGSPVRILVVKLSSFGDIILNTGALRAIRRALPHASIALAVEQRWADVVRNNPNVHALIECSARDRLSPAYLAEIHGHLAMHPKFDVAIDFQGTRRSAAWIYLTGSRIKVGRGRFRPGWDAAFDLDRTRHAVEVCAEVCRGIGVPADHIDPEIHTSSLEEQRLDEFLDAERLPRSGFILFNPFSRWNSKSWPEQHAAAFVNQWKKSPPDHLILTGGPDGNSRAEKLLRQIAPGAISSLVGRLPLGQALCLYRRARLMISCDSGPMHAAAAFGVPVVALFGPTHPEHTRPWGPNHRVVQALRPASHHAYRNAMDTSYMQAIDSSMVFEAASAKLESERVPQ